MNVEDRNQCGFGASDRRSAPVGLGALANYGGPTNTRSITQTSPAFDFAGDCLMADQRSLLPAFAACDSGAFELQPGDPVDGSPPPGGATDPTGTPLDELPAELSAYSLSKRAFTTKRKGTTVNYTLSEPATLTFTAERVKGGRLVRSVSAGSERGRTSPSRNATYRSRSCSPTRARRVPTRSSSTASCSADKSLKPGKYQLVAAAIDAAGNATLPQRAEFRITRPG